MSITVKKEVIDFKMIPLKTRVEILISVKPDNANFETWGQAISEKLGLEEFGFFCALQSFYICFKQGIEVEDWQYAHWNVTEEEIENLFDMISPRYKIKE